MKPLVTFADPEAAMIGYVIERYADRPEPYKPNSVDQKFPGVLATGQTHVQVELEYGNPNDYPVTERAQVRFTCYADKNSRSDVKRLASLTQGLVYGHPGDAQVAGTSPLMGRSDVITDPDTKNLMVWFTFRVNMLAVLATA